MEILSLHHSSGPGCPGAILPASFQPAGEEARSFLNSQYEYTIV